MTITTTNAQGADAFNDGGLTSQLKTATIMMVDDEPIMMEIVQAYLEEDGYTRFVNVSESPKAMDMLQQENPDILLLDLNMPEVNGYEILAAVRGLREFRHMPVIVLTSSSDAESKLKALELGATDFLAKPVDPSELILRLRNTLTSKAYQDQLAYYDELTSLPNRKLFIDRLDWALRRNKRDQEKLAVISIGLDRFKQVNESLGLKGGDQLLQMVADRMQTGVRQEDVISRAGKEELWRNLSRLGGDEFSILLPKIQQAENAAYVARRTLECFDRAFVVDGQEIFISASAGIAIAPEDGIEADELIKHAGEATDYAKSQGRNNYQFYSAEINARSRDRLSMETELRYALERDQFELHYQPKVNPHTGQLTGMEALLRWNHPTLGMVPPFKFIPLAEEVGLIIDIGEWVIFEACRQNKAWQEQGLNGLKVSVNVSAAQIQQQALFNTIRTALQQSDLDPQLLVVEVTESMAMENPEQKIELLNEIKTLGISFSVDDFGTGYSSFSYLQRLPIAELKIDRSFVIDTPDKKEDASIVRAIIAMAHSLGLKVVAEGVEEEAQLAFLQSLNCDVIQGYYYSRPLPHADFFTYAKQLQGAD